MSIPALPFKAVMRMSIPALPFEAVILTLSLSRGKNPRTLPKAPSHSSSERQTQVPQTREPPTRVPHSFAHAKEWGIRATEAGAGCPIHRNLIAMGGVDAPGAPSLDSETWVLTPPPHAGGH